LQNVFCCVFELPSLKNTRKCDKTKKVEEKLTSKFLSKFWRKVFDTDFLPKYFNGVFELPLPRNAEKRTKKTATKKKEKREVPTYLIYHLPDTRRFHQALIFFPLWLWPLAPLDVGPGQFKTRHHTI
jgi:hypothetical protein